MGEGGHKTGPVSPEHCMFYREPTDLASFPVSVDSSIRKAPPDARVKPAASPVCRGSTQKMLGPQEVGTVSAIKDVAQDQV